MQAREIRGLFGPWPVQARFIPYAADACFGTVDRMYLVHVRLRPPTPGCTLPAGFGSLLRAMTTPLDGVEHVAAHPQALPFPILGLYLMADCLRSAEERAGLLAQRWVTEIPLLKAWQPVSAEAPLVAPFYERLLFDSGPGGLNGPGPVRSS